MYPPPPAAARGMDENEAVNVIAPAEGLMVHPMNLGILLGKPSTVPCTPALYRDPGSTTGSPSRVRRPWAVVAGDRGAGPAPPPQRDCDHVPYADAGPCGTLSPLRRSSASPPASCVPSPATWSRRALFVDSDAASIASRWATRRPCGLRRSPSGECDHAGPGRRRPHDRGHAHEEHPPRGHAPASPPA